MSANNISWFHCGRCGSLFQSTPGESEDRLCPSCGCNPWIGTEPAAPQQAEATAPRPMSLRESPTQPRKKEPVRRRKGSHVMLYLITGWIAVLVAIVFAARQFWGSGSEKAPVQTAAAAKASIPPQDLALISESGQERSAALTGFLTAGNPENRNQFVSSPITTAARMARFYSMNPMPDIDPTSLAMKASSVIKIPGKTAIEAQLASADGRLFDVAFLRENDEWKIDWDHFVRYSETPWPLFLSGSGEAEGEFRLLARERLAEERKGADTISLVFYAPRFGYANDTGLQSPEFIVPRDSRNGRLLEAAFALQKSGDRVFGSKLPDLNPEGLIRVRVRIHRIGVDKVRRFEIKEIVACHWYSDDHPGVEPAETGINQPVQQPAAPPAEK